MKLTKKVAEAVEPLLNQELKLAIDEKSSQEDRFNLIDAYMEKESAKHQAFVAGKQVNRSGDKTKTRDLEIPICFIQHDTALSSMVSTFLGGEPIFAATAGRQHEDAAAMLTALSQRDQHRFRWRSQLIQTMDDVLKYNLCAAKVNWEAKKTTIVETAVSEEASYTGLAQAIIYEGNEIKRIDPYNLILDPSVAPHEVHEHGMYVGYAEALNRMAFERFVANLDAKFVYRDGVRTARETEATWAIYAERPSYNDLSKAKDKGDFSGFFGNSINRNSTVGLTKSFEVVHMYLRLIPSDFSIDVPNPTSVQVFYAIWANGKLIYIEPCTTGLEFLPIIVGTRFYGGKTKKSFVEYIMDLQDVATSVTHGTLDSIRRAVQDRALYDPSMVTKEAVNSPNPIEKIAVNVSAFGTGLDAAYKPIPYIDSVSPLYTNMQSFVFSMADQTTGQNQSSQGQHIKGNKTLFEFDTIMSNAEGRGQLGKIIFNETFLQPIQEILKLNYLLYSQNEAIDNGTAQDSIEIDPTMLREYAPNFLMADGILPSTKIANTEVAMQALQLMGADPMIQVEYNIGALAISMLKQQGLTDIEAYKRTPEEQEQYLGISSAMQGQAEPQSNQE